MRVLYIAESLAPGKHASDAAYTDSAAVAACPVDVEAVTFAEFDEAMLAQRDVIVVAQSTTATRAQIRAITRTRRHVAFEHDMRDAASSETCGRRQPSWARADDDCSDVFHCHFIGGWLPKWNETREQSADSRMERGADVGCAVRQNGRESIRC